MATRKKRRSKSKIGKITSVATILVVVIAVIIYKFVLDKPEQYEIPDGTAQFHFIDVGQGDASLIATDGKFVLIDTGDVDGKDALISYLNSHGVTEIEYFVVTHPDADHFASASYVLQNYKVKNIIMSEFTKTTKMYETFINTVTDKKENSGLNVISANEVLAGSDESKKKYYIGDLELELLSPLKSYSDCNEESVVLMARFGNKKVLYTGDAEKKAEEDILSKYPLSKFDCDVLKVGHHGSDSSSTQPFLDAVKPEFAVISCGEGNKYFHPHKVTLDKLNAIKDIQIYRTDLVGTIVFETNGETIYKLDNKTNAPAFIIPYYTFTKNKFVA